MFEIYKESIEIKTRDGVTTNYTMSPLKGEYLPLLYQVLKEVEPIAKEVDGSEEDEDSSAFFELMGSEVTTTLHKLIYESLINNYPSEDKEKINLFVSQNLLKFLPGLIKVNIPNQEGN